jgi:hypothetical protein
LSIDLLAPVVACRPMRLIIFLLIVAAVALWWGGQNTYIALRDRTQLEVSCADFLKKRPDSRWLKLTHCEYDFDHMAYEQYKSGKISKVYLPLRPEGEEVGRPTRIVVVRDDDDMLKVAQALENDEAEPQPAMFNVTTSLTKPAEGLVQFGLDLNDKDKKELGALGLGLGEDFVLIDYGSKPKLQKGLIALGVGLGAIGLLTFLILRRFRKPKAPPAPPRPVNPNNPIAAFEKPL